MTDEQPLPAPDAEVPTWFADAVPMSTEMLKAFANPLRQRIMNLMRRQRFVRAADVASALGEPANKVSFHLRVLADAGLIEEAPEQARDGRDRVWTTRAGSLSMGDKNHPVTDSALGNTVIQSFVSEHNELVRRIASWALQYVQGQDPEAHGTFTQSSMRLTDAEFRALMTKVHAAFDEAKAAHIDGVEGERFYEVHVLAADETL